MAAIHRESHRAGQRSKRSAESGASATTVAWRARPLNRWMCRGRRDGRDFVTDEYPSKFAILPTAASDSRRRTPCPDLYSMPKLFSDPEAIAEDIIRDVGTNLVVGLPLGLGKANHIVNALYARAGADRSINLTFFTALTLEKPQADKSAAVALHRARDRPSVRRLSRSRLCRSAARRCAAAQHSA